MTRLPHPRRAGSPGARLTGADLAQARARRARAARRSRTRRRLARAVCCIAVFALLCVPAVYVNNLAGYLPALTFAALVALSGAYLLVARRCLRVEQPAQVGTCVRGQSVELGVTLVNRGPLPLLGVEATFFSTDLFGTEDTLQTARLALAPFETYRFAFDLRFDHIGTYEAGLSQVVLHDLLGVFSATAAAGARHTVEVQPRVFDVSRLDLGREYVKEQPEARRSFSNDGSDYTGVRAYALGDPMKRVHWKLSARTEEYRTKLFETLGEPGIEAVLDFGSPAYDAEGLMCVFDAVVESALSVGAHAAAHGMDFELVYRDRRGADARVGTRAGGVTRGGFLASLPCVAPADDSRELVELLRRECASPFAQRTVVVCTARVDDALVRELVNVKRRRRTPLLMAVVPPSLDEKARRALLAKPLAALDAAGIRHMTVSSADELEGR